MLAENKTAPELSACLKSLRSVAALWSGTVLTAEFVVCSLGMFEVLCEKPADFWLQITEVSSSYAGLSWRVDHNQGAEAVLVKLEYPDMMWMKLIVEENSPIKKIFQIDDLISG